MKMLIIIEAYLILMLMFAAGICAFVAGVVNGPSNPLIGFVVGATLVALGVRMHRWYRGS